MSLNRALSELFKAIREEAQQNPAFAARLDAALAVYRPPRRGRAKPPARPAAAPSEEALARVDAAIEAFDPEPPPAPPPPDLNPISLYSLAGEEALRSELSGEAYSGDALAALIAEHNLDPAGEAAGGDKPALVEQIVAQARRRVERDRKLFDY